MFPVQLVLGATFDPLQRPRRQQITQCQKKKQKKKQLHNIITQLFTIQTTWMGANIC